MARKLSSLEFFSELARRTNKNEDDIKFIWQETVDFIVDEMLMYGFINLPFIGKLENKHIKERIGHVPNSKEDKIRLNTDKPSRKILIPVHNEAKLYPSDVFKEQINENRSTRSTIMRQREILRKQKREEEELEKQREIIKKIEEQTLKMRKTYAQRIKKNKDFNKLSKKKQKEFLDKESSYCFEEEQE